MILLGVYLVRVIKGVALCLLRIIPALPGFIQKLSWIKWSSSCRYFYLDIPCCVWTPLYSPPQFIVLIGRKKLPTIVHRSNLYHDMRITTHYWSLPGFRHTKQSKSTWNNQIYPSLIERVRQQAPQVQIILTIDGILCGATYNFIRSGLPCHLSINQPILGGPC